MFLRFFIITFFVCFSQLAAVENYDVDFHGEVPQPLQTLIVTASDLIALKCSPPATKAGLKHRAEADIENFLKVLHSQAYYDAKVDLSYDFTRCPAVVNVNINLGSVYPLAGFKVVPSTTAPCTAFPYDSLTLQNIGITLQEPALPKTILQAEEAVLFLFAKQGYPLAKIVDREVIADQQCHAIYVTLHMDSGPLATFGLTEVVGLCRVKEDFLRKKIAWQTGSLYNPWSVEGTQSAIEATGLFSSITITNAGELDCHNQLPMQIEVIEGKHRSVGWGLTFATQRGPGVAFEWEHRNFFGGGEKLSFDANLWWDLQDVYLVYVQPDFLHPTQDFLWLAEAVHDRTKGFTEASFSLSGLIERQLNRNTRISYGGTYKILRDTRSEEGDGQFNLLKAPFYIRYSNVDDALDPTCGGTAQFRMVPSWQFVNQQFVYCINTLINTFYHPVTKDKSVIFAFKSTLGSIFGSNRRTIPASEKFYAGSDNTLRGYRFETVSPLGIDHKPLGGRSMMIFGVEARVRATENFGWVLFYDVGNVYSNPLPKLDHKVLQSVGWGLRYHTPVGPLRFDFAVPLNRRRHLDDHFQIYLSIGQAF